MAGARPGRTRCSRTTRSSGWACGWPPTGTPDWPAAGSPSCVSRSVPSSPRRSSARRTARVRTGGAARPGRRAEAADRRAARAGRRRPAQCHRRPGPAQRVDRRRRRLGLRHRRRRPRPRAGQRPQRERAGARHRGVLQHRRAGVQGDPAGRRRQVRRGGQDGAEEGPRPAGDRVRQRVRRPGGDGRRPAADAQGVPRSRGLRRAVADHRLQPLHRARHRDARRARPAVPGGGQRSLAADPLRPGGARWRRQPVPARLAAPPDTTGRLHRPGAALPRARQHRPRRGRAARRAGPASGGPAVGHLRGDGDPRPGAVPAGRAQ